LLEAMSLAMPDDPHQIDPRMLAVIEEARAIDVERRRRG
jgi:hypothetical protein